MFLEDVVCLHVAVFKEHLQPATAMGKLGRGAGGLGYNLNAWQAESG